MTRPMTREEVAEFLQVTERAVDNYVKDGLLPCLRGPDGTRIVRFDPEDVRKFFVQSKGSCQPDKKEVSS
jgi:predicted site-specific integrase-resolvase